VTRFNPVRRDEIVTARQGFENRLQEWVAKANIYLQEYPGARIDCHVGIEDPQRFAQRLGIP